ncbi:hypothetical protein CAC42_1080 [Sphaceloma murrayae]|uniref:Uncharacterized protein n=1 Tax=Sphaceloma murrayae TaxID=2082308 RepID=A0A2K1R1Z3_9PEZI|nr:hypothetical protein CAC42_1080 [Sphaceloma murrayae]
MVWLRVLEAYAVQALLRSDAFHAMVRKVHGGVQGFRHGYLQHFMKELQEQSGIQSKKQGALGERLHQKMQQSTPPPQEDIHHTQKPSFAREFLDELKKNTKFGNQR